MDKILVEIYLPAADARYDVYLPPHSRMHEVLLLVSKLLADLSTGKFIPSDETVICDRETGAILDINLSVADLGLKNGSRLMLI